MSPYGPLTIEVQGQVYCCLGNSVFAFLFTFRTFIFLLCFRSQLKCYLSNEPALTISKLFSHHHSTSLSIYPPATFSISFIIIRIILFAYLLITLFSHYSVSSRRQGCFCHVHHYTVFSIPRTVPGTYISIQEICIKLSTKQNNSQWNRCRYL